MEEIKILARSSFNFVQLRFLAVLILTGVNTPVHSQCTNSNQFPASPIIASQFNDTLIITDMQEAGQYYIIRGLALNRTYQFGSSDPGDFVTIRDRDGITPLAFGVTPVSYTITADDVVTVHINLSAGCGSEALFRTTTATCLDCPGVPGRFGIAETDPVATLDVQGGVRVGNATRPAEAGMIRWNEDAADFEGFDGQKWRSFTKAASGWGEIYSILEMESASLNSPIMEPQIIFGNKVDISDKYAFVSGFPDADSVLVYTLENGHWNASANVFAPSGESIEQYRFGISLEFDNDFLVVGADYANVNGVINQGAAFVYRRSGDEWTLVDSLVGTGTGPWDRFGIDVSIDGDLIAVGALGEDFNGIENIGAVYVFERNGSNWDFLQKIIPEDGNVDGGFGSAVCLFEDFLVVGAPGDSAGIVPIDNGSMYVYQKTGSQFTQIYKHSPLIGFSGDGFGSAVSISDSFIVCGARLHDLTQDGNEGAAYLYKYDGTNWMYTSKLTSPDVQLNAGFGVSVSIDGDYLIIGSFLEDVGPDIQQGTAYLYKLEDDEWVLRSKLESSDGRIGDQFGADVRLHDNQLIIGAPFHGLGGTGNIGKAYIFKRN